MAKLNLILEGLQILAKYDDDSPCGVDAEHDMLYVSSNKIPKEMDREDRRALVKAGWRYDCDISRWYHYA